jgi:hypothetical protein
MDILREQIQEFEKRAATLDKQLTEAVGRSTEEAAIISADLLRVRELIAVSREMRKASLPPGAPCGASAEIERRNAEAQASDDAQFRYESERRLAQVKNE